MKPLNYNKGTRPFNWHAESEYEVITRLAEDDQSVATVAREIDMSDQYISSHFNAKVQASTGHKTLLGIRIAVRKGTKKWGFVDAESQYRHTEFKKLYESKKLLMIDGKAQITPYFPVTAPVAPASPAPVQAPVQVKIIPTRIGMEDRAADPKLVNAFEFRNLNRARAAEARVRELQALIDEKNGIILTLTTERDGARAEIVALGEALGEARQPGNAWPTAGELKRVMREAEDEEGEQVA